MRTVILGLTLGLVTALSVPASAAPKASRPPKTAGAAGSAESAGGKEEQKLREHMRLREHIAKHVKYPATKQELVAACKGMKEMKTDDKKWFEETLPDKTYHSPDEVVKALGWDATPPENADKTTK